MLRLLYLKDFAIVDEMALEPGPGMTVLSGETGAGKSLLVDALLLLSGTRSDASWVRAGCERAELAAEFDVPGDCAVADKLRELELDDGEGCRLRRVLRADGSSRAYVNDRPASIGTLRELAAHLIEIHGQHEHQALLERSAQLALLDAYGGHDLSLATVAQAARRMQAIDKELANFAPGSGLAPERADWLRFQLQELERDALGPEAYAALEDEHKRLSHAGDLLSGCERVLERLDGDDESAVTSALSHAEGELRQLAELDPRLAPCLDSLAQANVLADDAAHQLRRYRDQIDLDPPRLSELDGALARILALARKHRVIPGELLACRDSLRGELDQVLGAEQRQRELAEERERAAAQWREAAAALGAKRRTAARRLGTAVGALMAELGMAGGRFEAALEADRADSYGVGGAESCEFMVSANPGQPARPLRKVASGGELSRIALAIEVAALGKDKVPTMVFDEVDSGIGGAVAEVVGRKLRALGETCQVLCVTHLPQVAAQGHAQVAVRKRVNGARGTEVELQPLADRTREEELARMLGGIEITSKTLAHAGDMLRRAQGR